MTRLWIAAALCALLAVPVLAAVSDDTKLGAGVSITEATPIATILARPDDFVGKTIRVDGVATAVCEDMGCWMSIASEADAAKTIRVKVEDGVIVFPMSAKGKKVSAEGVFEVVGPKDAETKRYQLKGTGAVIR